MYVLYLSNKKQVLSSSKALSNAFYPVTVKCVRSETEQYYIKNRMQSVGAMKIENARPNLSNDSAVICSNHNTADGRGIIHD